MISFNIGFFVLFEIYMICYGTNIFIKDIFGS